MIEFITYKLLHIFISNHNEKRIVDFLISNKYSKHIRNLYAFARTADDIADHKMHAEWGCIQQNTVDKIEEKSDKKSEFRLFGANFAAILQVDLIQHDL